MSASIEVDANELVVCSTALIRAQIQQFVTRTIIVARIEADGRHAAQRAARGVLFIHLNPPQFHARGLRQHGNAHVTVT